MQNWQSWLNAIPPFKKREHIFGGDVDDALGIFWNALERDTGF